MLYPKISIVTISLNCSAFIEDCICSVLQQGYPNLEYIVVDGGSTDDTLSIIHKYENNISHIISEADSGPADALKKGFSKATGELMCWLNADDRLQPKSLFAIAELFNTFEKVEWVMGYPSWLNSNGVCLNEIFYQPDKFYHRSSYINDNLYMKFACWSKWRFAMDDFSAIQQESVFWRRSLWEKTGAYIKQNVIAYDLELWTRFFNHANLYTTNVVFASFRVHGNQISAKSRHAYKAESQKHIDFFKEKHLANSMSNKIRLPLAKAMKVFYYYDIPILKRVYPYLLGLPPFIYYNLHLKQFCMTVK